MTELTSALKPVAILEYLATHENGFTLRDLREEFGMARSSAWHIVRQLEDGGFVTRVDANTFKAGSRLLRMGLSLYQTATLGGIAHGALERLSALTGLDVYLAIRSGDAVVYADRVTGRRSVQLNRDLGSPRPLHASAPGKLFLAYESDGLWDRCIAGQELTRYTAATVVDPKLLRDQLVRAQEDGYIETNGEVLGSIASLAAMVLNPDGSPWAGVVLSAHESDLAPVHDNAVSALLATVAEIGELRANLV